MKQTMNWLVREKAHLAYYLIGIFLLGFGVNLMKASTLGAGAWDTVTINIRDYLMIVQGNTWVTLGAISFSISLTIMLIVFLYRRKWKFLLMIVPVILVALAIDFWNVFVFLDRAAGKFAFKLLFYLVGTFTLPFGLALIVKSSYPAFVFDEWMLMLVKIFKAKKITFVRLGIEFTGIAIGALFGYLTYYASTGGFGAVNLGSFIFSFMLSPIMATYYKWMKIHRKD